MFNEKNRNIRNIKDSYILEIDVVLKRGFEFIGSNWFYWENSCYILF